MSRRQTLGALSPSQLNSNRPSAAAGRGGGKPDGPRMSLKPQAGRPSMAPPSRPAERPSGMGADPRRSSAFGKAGGSNGLKQDPRPLGDKNFFNSCIRTVITYLSTHGYPYALSPKLLASPTGKDFAQMVQFLFQKFDPALKAFGKVEDEVPLFFKRLNYPFQVGGTSCAVLSRACGVRLGVRWGLGWLAAAAVRVMSACRMRPGWMRCAAARKCSQSQQQQHVSCGCGGSSSSSRWQCSMCCGACCRARRCAHATVHGAGCIAGTMAAALLCLHCSR